MPARAMRDAEADALADRVALLRVAARVHEVRDAVGRLGEVRMRIKARCAEAIRPRQPKAQGFYTRFC